MNSKHILYIIGIVLLSAFSACTDDETFSTSTSNLLTFSTDTVRLDTTFSNVPTTAKTLWLFNRSGAGIRLSSVRLENGNQSGYRVNVNGTYLGPTVGYQDHDIEIRKGDSIRIFVELTSASQRSDVPQLVEDNLIFNYESGVEQKVNLNGYSWDATLLQSPRISHDTLISSTKPVVVFGGMYVDSAATLTLGQGTTLYFHENAGLHVYGKLISSGTPENNVVLRGDRIDHMFDYLPYDRTPGQWRGIHFYASSYDNRLQFTDLHSAYSGIVCDSADITRTKVSLFQSTIHNCQNAGIATYNNKVEISNCLLSNNGGGCAVFNGGDINMSNTTLAQFYPFSANRKAAIIFSGKLYPLQTLNVYNSLITGYSNDELMGYPGDTFNYQFVNCIIRTPRITGADSVKFARVIYEDVKDTTKYGEKHFVKLDTDNLIYDFHLDSISAAIGAADPASSSQQDRDGRERDDKPDVGCYEYIKK